MKKFNNFHFFFQFYEKMKITAFNSTKKKWILMNFFCPVDQADQAVMDGQTMDGAMATADGVKAAVQMMLKFLPTHNNFHKIVVKSMIT